MEIVCLGHWVGVDGPLPTDEREVSNSSIP